jgi:signal transduction histidine kinase
MHTLAKTLRQRTTRVIGASAAQAMPPVVPPENRQGPMFTTDPLSMSIIHDLRNPLAAICAGAEMLNDAKLSPDHVMRLGGNIRKAACRMQELLDDLAAVTQGKPSVAENCNLREILGPAYEDAVAAAADQGVDILLDLPEPMEMTVARTRMERVFTNLIRNALEAMPKGGEIRITAKESGDCALIEVEDSGPGIPPEIYGRLFDPFVTARKKDGLGLGLALSRRTVRDHGGDMWIEPAGGARFLICLPLSRVFKAAFNGTSSEEAQEVSLIRSVILPSLPSSSFKPRPVELWRDAVNLTNRTSP